MAVRVGEKGNVELRGLKVTGRGAQGWVGYLGLGFRSEV